jgi:rhamnosyltransferase
MTEHTPDKICAIVVTFNPDNEFFSRVSKIASQVDNVLIVDNNSEDVAVQMLCKLSSAASYYLISNKNNLGVASALNIGMNWAKEYKYNWVITFDQDTLVSDTMIQSLLTVGGKIGEVGEIALIGANYLDSGSGKSYLKTSKSHNKSYVEVKTVITSGCLMPIALFEKLGPFRDEFFIDFVDIEYCLRARARGYKVYVSSNPLMQHAVGAVTMHSLPWKVAGTTNHNALRRYFMARNFMVIALEYFMTEPLWVAVTFIKRIKSIMLMCLFEDDKLIKLKLTILGAFDGAIGNFNRKLDL